jgi:hypothetical protein
MLAEVGPDGVAYVSRTVTEFRPVRETYQVNVNGKTEVRERTRIVGAMREVRVPLQGPNVRVFGTDGKRIDPKDLPNLLKKSTPVMVSADGNEIDPLYLRLVQPGTLVIVAPDLADFGRQPPPGLVPGQPKVEIPVPKKG